MTLLGRAIVRAQLKIGATPETPNSLVFEGVFREQNVEEWFRPLIDELHARAVTLKLDEVVLDLRQLEYANAAAWKCLVYWMRLLQDDGNARYNVRIVANEAHRWQRVGMPSLQVFGRDRLIIESHGKAS